MQKNEHQKEYIQACQEILESLEILLKYHPEYEHQHLLERFLEPERFIQFRVSWMDDSNQVHVNRGFRV